jgi:hypothetical protein
LIPWGTPSTQEINIGAEGPVFGDSFGNPRRSIDEFQVFPEMEKMRRNNPKLLCSENEASRGILAGEGKI